MKIIIIMLVPYCFLPTNLDYCLQLYGTNSSDLQTRQIAGHKILVCLLFPGVCLLPQYLAMAVWLCIAHAQLGGQQTRDVRDSRLLIVCVYDMIAAPSTCILLNGAPSPNSSVPVVNASCDIIQSPPFPDVTSLSYILFTLLISLTFHASSDMCVMTRSSM